MTNYKTLIKILETCDDAKFDPDEDDFRLVLHDLSIENDFEGARALIETYAKFYFRVYGNHFEDYNHALKIAQRDLDSYSEDADRVFHLKKFSQKIGYIQKFFRKVINFSEN